MRLRARVAAVLIAVALPSWAAPGDATAPFLWEVQGSKARHWLLGSVHLLPPTAHPLPMALESAYAASRVVVFETNLEAVGAPEMQGRMLGAAREDRPGGLEGQIGRALYAQLQERAEALGMPTPVCQAFRAWFCALALELYRLQVAQFSMEHGIDPYFHARAREDGRRIAALESPDYQISLFTSMPDAISRQILAATLDEATYSSQSPEELYRIWRRGDVAALDKLVKEMRREYPELHARLLADRNRAWVPQLIEHFAGDAPTLVVVGAAHFVGPEGLLALLKAQNVDVRPVSGPVQATAERTRR